MGTSDGELVRRVLAGEAGAYATLVARYRDRLGRYACHMLGNREDAEDVLQETFLRAYKSLERCEEPERFGGWLFGILVNRCRTAGGRAARFRRLFTRDPGSLEQARAPSTTERDELDEVLRWALSRLAPAHREAFLLKYVEELDYAEMARLTGHGVSALKMRVKRARERLQTMLQEVERV